MLVLQFLFRTVLAGLILKLLGGFAPILRRLIRLWR